MVMQVPYLRWNFRIYLYQSNYKSKLSSEYWPQCLSEVGKWVDSSSTYRSRIQRRILKCGFESTSEFQVRYQPCYSVIPIRYSITSNGWQLNTIMVHSFSIFDWVKRDLLIRLGKPWLLAMIFYMNASYSWAKRRIHVYCFVPFSFLIH